jgi:hypothetical protein
MTRQGLNTLGSEKFDLVILENVGNLVCPAEFDTGSCKNMTILSVPEGHDKPLKYPLMYETCQLLVVNKIDVLPYFDFDTEKVVEYARMRNPDIKVIFASARTGEGVDAVADWILESVEECNLQLVADVGDIDVDTQGLDFEEKSESKDYVGKKQAVVIDHKCNVTLKADVGSVKVNK